MIIRPIRIRDKPAKLPPNVYAFFKLKGNEIACELQSLWLYVTLNPEEVSWSELGGTPTRESTFNLPVVDFSGRQGGKRA